MTLAQESAADATIHAYGVIGRPPLTELIAVARLVADLCDVPMGTVDLLTDLEQHQIATFGFEGASCLRSDAMCAVALADAGPKPLVVRDARYDARFADNPFVTGEFADVRFFAAHPLQTPSGLVVGALCVADVVPRTLTSDQISGLTTLAERVVDILELGLRSGELATSLTRQELIRGELEQSNDRLAGMAGQVSHDLKTPLVSLTVALEMLREEIIDGSGPDQTLLLLDRATRSSVRMAAMIDDVLDFARLGGALSLVDVDLDVVLEEVLVDLGDTIAGVALEIHPLPVVRGDRVQLHAVLQNLLSNAAKYRVSLPQVRVSATQTSDGWRVEIADNGPGVVAHDRSRLFEPLTRGTTSVEGSGIGLATCLRVIEAHAGRIGLADTPGGGTTAWFELPRSEPAMDHGDSSEVERAARPGNGS